MKCGRILLTALLMQSTGCSTFIAASGKDLSPLETREQVQQEFGSPEWTGEGADGPIESYTTRRKIADQIKGWGHGMAFAMTFGVYETIAFPYEVYHLARGTVAGQELQFNYDASGRVTQVFINGERLSLPPKEHAVSRAVSPPVDGNGK